MAQNRSEGREISDLAFALGAVVGGLAGFAMGVLFAPKSGAETRKELKEKGQELAEKAQKEVKKMQKEGFDIQKLVSEKVKSRK